MRTRVMLPSFYPSGSMADAGFPPRAFIQAILSSANLQASGAAERGKPIHKLFPQPFQSLTRESDWPRATLVTGSGPFGRLSGEGPSAIDSLGVTSQLGLFRHSCFRLLGAPAPGPVFLDNLASFRSGWSLGCVPTGFVSSFLLSSPRYAGP